jgi:MEDS: MEthanogen/methylotroph, DcmR Sensory domain
VLHEPLFRFEHGDHACIFYQSEDSLTDVLLSYLVEGLAKQEKCFCVQKPHIVQRVCYELRLADINVEKEMRRGALEFHSEAETYHASGKFRPAAMIELLKESIDASVKQGFSGFRSAGDLAWGLEDHGDCKKVLDYERRVARSFSGRPLTGLCQYPIKALSKKTLAALVETHTVNVVDPSPRSMYAWIQLRMKGFVAEIVTDRFVRQPEYSYLVRHADSDELLLCGSAKTFEAARSKAEQMLRVLALRKQGRAKRRKRSD